MTAERLAADCGAAIAAAERAVAEGALLDLAGFEAEIARLCAAAAELPPGERAAAGQALRRLDADLDRLAATLRQQRGRGIAADERAARGRAGLAYGRAPGVSAPKDC
jgi:hypothetical protein